MIFSLYIKPDVLKDKVLTYWSLPCFYWFLDIIVIVGLGRVVHWKNSAVCHTTQFGRFTGEDRDQDAQVLGAHTYLNMQRLDRQYRFSLSMAHYYFP